MNKIKPVEGVSPARAAAAFTLREVAANPHAQASDVLSRFTHEFSLRPDDARLARTITFGVLRHALTLDYYYQPFLRQPAFRLEEPLRLSLRMAACQHWLLSRIPPFAIANETIEIARKILGVNKHQVGFLNAVIRKILALEQPPELPQGNRVRDLSVRFSQPPEVASLLVEKFGTHKAIALMEAQQQEAPLTLRVNTLKTSPEDLSRSLEAAGFVINPGSLPASLQLVSTPPGQSLFQTDVFNAGHFYVQDEASQLVAHIVNPVAGEHILDFSSAPGGKTTHMAELSAGAAVITASDISPDRLLRLQENLSRLETPGVSVQQMDDLTKAKSLYDAVLVDAPCTGLGTLRKNPEIRYRVTAQTLAEQSVKQLEILALAARHVRAGGRLVYSTCSFSTQENAAVLRQFLKTHPEFQLEPTAPNSTSETYLAPDGHYRTWPTHTTMDGFEAAVLRKTS